jgi:hypothetical protein|tara:strand:+ start:76 stop:273 length:198 start_codon:yes stop_codon:yes gene_type:complete
MLVPQKNELLHLKIQAVMREHNFEDSELKYLGIQEQENGTPNHYYMIAGEHRVSVDQIEDFEQVS